MANLGGSVSIYLKQDEVKKLDYLCEVLNKNRSALFKDMLNSAYDDFQNMDGLFIDDEKKVINKEFNVLDLLNNLSNDIQSIKKSIEKKWKNKKAH